MAKLILTNEQHTKIVNHILSDIINEDLLSEGVWEKVKYGLSKLGRYKAGGKIMGKSKVDQETAAKIQAIIEKKGNEVIQSLDNEIKNLNPQFPNNEKGSEFLQTIMSIAAIYDSIIEATKKNPEDQGYLPVDAANGVINDLREYVKKFLDVDLKAVYSVVDEIEGNVLDITEEELKKLEDAFGLHSEQITEDRPYEKGEPENITQPVDLNPTDTSTQSAPQPTQQAAANHNAGDVRAQLQAKRGDGDDFDSERMKTLKSNKLPMTLMGIGASLGAFNWLVNTEWFKHLFDTVSQTQSVENVNQVIQTKSDIFANIKPGEGMTQIMNRLNNAGLTPNSTPEQFLEQVKILGGGNLQQGIDALSQHGGIFSTPDQAKAVLSEIAKNPHGHGNTLGQIYQGKWAGTGKSLGDSLVTLQGGQLQGLIVKTLTTAVPKIITKTAIKTGAGYAAAKGLGSVLGPIGVGLLAAGALVKLMRIKGQKQSRAKTLNDLYQSIRNIGGGVGIIEPQGELTSTDGSQTSTDTGGQPNNNPVSRGNNGASGSKSGSNDDLYNSLRNLFKFIVNNRKMLGTRSADNVGTGAAMANGRMKAGDTYNYNGKPVKILNPNVGDGRTQVQSNDKAKNKFTVPTDNLQKLSENQLFEGQYITDKRLLQFLEKNLSYDKLKSFETLISRIEQLRNKIRNLKPTDKVLSKQIEAFKTNPIMATDFKQMFNVSADNPQAVNSLKAFIDDIFITLYSGKYKFGSLVDKMSSVGGGNVNSLEEGGEYNSNSPSKTFLKDAQDRRMFKKNLLSFLTNAINLFQYLHKVKSQGGSQQAPQQTANNAGSTNNTGVSADTEVSDTGDSEEREPKATVNHNVIRYESVIKSEVLTEEVTRIKNIMMGLI